MFTKKTIEFPFRYVHLPFIGEVFYPFVPIFLKTIKGWREFDFLVDTGADFTTLPRRAEEMLGINLSQCRETIAEGIGGIKVKIWEAKIPIRIKNFETKIRCSITEDDKTPFLLGRVDLLETHFSWHFDAKAKKIIFEFV